MKFTLRDFGGRFLGPDKTLVMQFSQAEWIEPENFSVLFSLNDWESIIFESGIEFRTVAQFSFPMQVKLAIYCSLGIDLRKQNLDGFSCRLESKLKSLNLKSMIEAELWLFAQTLGDQGTYFRYLTEMHFCYDGVKYAMRKCRKNTSPLCRQFDIVAE